jgi:hypothetical protein
MGNAWKQQDLGGGGLQQANLKLARTLRKRRTAYALLALFPVGAHRWYLAEPAGALAYCALTALAFFAWPFGAAALAFAMFDAWWIDRRVTALNKRLRMAALLGAGPGAPADYAGRFGSDAER